MDVRLEPCISLYVKIQFNFYYKGYSKHLISVDLRPYEHSLNKIMVLFLLILLSPYDWKNNILTK